MQGTGVNQEGIMLLCGPPGTSTSSSSNTQGCLCADSHCAKGQGINFRKCEVIIG